MHTYVASASLDVDAFAVMAVFDVCRSMSRRAPRLDSHAEHCRGNRAVFWVDGFLILARLELHLVVVMWLLKQCAAGHSSIFDGHSVVRMGG